MGNFKQDSKMKNIFILLSLCLCSFMGIKRITDTQKKESDVEKDNLSGKVKQVKTDCFDVEGKRCDDNNYLFIYNEKGYRVELAVHNSGWRNEKKVFKYDEKDKLTELILSDAANTLLGKFTYYYDEKGNNTESKYYNVEGDLKNRQTYKRPKRK